MVCSELCGVSSEVVRGVAWLSLTVTYWLSLAFLPPHCHTVILSDTLSLPSTTIQPLLYGGYNLYICFMLEVSQVFPPVSYNIWGRVVVSAGGERLSAGQMSEPKSLLVDTRLSGVHYFDVLAVMSWLAVILCNVLVRIINIHTANTAGQEIGYNFRSEKSVQSEATPPPPPPDLR